jgi:hypothetical protein
MKSGVKMAFQSYINAPELVRCCESIKKFGGRPVYIIKEITIMLVQEFVPICIAVGNNS